MIRQQGLKIAVFQKWLRTMVIALTCCLFSSNLFSRDFEQEIYASETTPIEISSAEDLKALSDAVYEMLLDLGYGEMPEINVVLTADIDMSGVADFKPIGGLATRSNQGLYYFSLDGNNHTISNLSIDIDASSGAKSNCFVGFVSSFRDGFIKNLKLQNVSINVDIPSTEVYSAGLLTGATFGGVIDNCEVSGSLNVVSKQVSGGLGGAIGYAYTGVKLSISNVSSKVMIENDFASYVKDYYTLSSTLYCGLVDTIRNNHVFVGGTIGFIECSTASLSATVKNIKSLKGASITLNHSTDVVGGVIGCIYQKNSGVSLSISDLHNYADVNAHDSKFVGGVIGMSLTKNDINDNVEYSNLFNSGNVYGTECVGGIVGFSCYSVFTKCVNLGNITGVNNVSSEYVGGIVGYQLVNEPFRVDLNYLSACINEGIVQNSNALSLFNGGIAGFLAAKNTEKERLHYPLFNCFNFASQPANTKLILGGSTAELSDKVYDALYHDATFISEGTDENATFLSTTELVSGDVALRYTESNSKYLLSVEQATERGLSAGLKVEEGFYPYIDVDCDISNVARASFVLAEDETINEVSSDFKVSTANGVEWSSKYGRVTINGEDASVGGTGADVLVASLGDVSKEVSINLVKKVFGGGFGTQESPYIIRNKSHLQELADSVANAKDELKGRFFRIVADIDDVDFVIAPTPAKKFAASIDGESHLIKLNVNSDAAGLFGYANGAVIKNIQVSGSVSGTIYAAGIVAHATSSTVSHCFNTAKVKGATAAGVVANIENGGSYTDLCNSGTVYGFTSVGGGVLGSVSGDCTIHDLVNSGYVAGNGASQQYVGGVIGVYDASSCAMTADVSMLFNYGTVSRGDITYTSLFIGYKNNVSLSNTTFDIQVCQNNQLDITVAKGGALPTTMSAPEGYTKDENTYPVPNWVKSMKDWELLAYPILLQNEEISSCVQTEPFAYDGMKINGARKVGETDETELVPQVLSLKSNETERVVVEIALENSATNMTRDVCVTLVKNFFTDGSGTEDDPYMLYNEADFETLSKLIAGTEVGYKFAYLTPRTDNWTKGKFFMQLYDISSVEKTLGYGSNQPFQGVYDGDNHTISVNLIERNSDCVALFPRCVGATVKNVNVSGRISGRDTVAAVIGSAVDCVELSMLSSTAIVSGNKFVGGVVGHISSSDTKVEQLASAGMVYGKESAGGIVGYSNADMTLMTNVAKVFSSDEGVASGITPVFDGLHLTKSSNAGHIKAGKAAGIVFSAKESSNISKCLNLNVVSGNETYPISSGISASSLYDDQLSLCGEGSRNTLSLLKLNSGTSTIDTKDDCWSASNSEYLYPAIEYFSLSMINITSVSSASVVLNQNDKINKIQNPFELYSAKGVNWRAKKGARVVDITRKSIDNGICFYEATPVAIGNDTLIVSVGGIDKYVPIYVDCVPKITTVNLSGCDTVMIPNEDGEYQIIDAEGHSQVRVSYTQGGTSCDSIVVYEIDIHKPVVTVKDTVNCVPIVLKNTQGVNTTFIEDGVLKVVKNDCDTLIWNVRIIQPTTEAIDVAPACDILTYEGTDYTESTKFQKTLKSKVCDCDSIIYNVSITVNKSYDILDELPAVVDSMVYGDEVIKESTIKTIYDGVSSTGCDSVHKVSIKIINPQVAREEIYVCGEYVDVKNGNKRYTADVELFDTVRVGDEVNVSIREVKIHHNSAKDTSYLEDVYGCGFASVVSSIAGSDVITNYDESTTLITRIERENKCDSIVIRNVFVHAPTVEIVKDTIFGCEQYVDNLTGRVFTADETIIETTKTVDLRCDSIITKQPYVIEKQSRFAKTINGCETATYQKYSGEKLVFNYSTTLSDTLWTLHGCISKINDVKVVVANPIDIYIDTVSCSPIEFEGVVYEEGITEFVDIVPNSTGSCDSLIRHIKISVLDRIVKDSVIYACQSVTVNGEVYTRPYQEIEKRVGLASNGICDSFILYRIFVLQPQETELTVEGCGAVEFEGAVYTEDTELVKHISSKLCDCDSTVYIHIIVGSTSLTEKDTSSCYSLELAGVVYTQNTTVDFVYENGFGCDSIVRYNVRILNSTYKTINIEGETDVEFEGVVYKRSQTFTYTTVNANGCDSIVTVNIKINKELGYPVIVDKFGYVLFCNNNIGKEKFVSYQWFKNGEPIEGATKDYYEEALGQKLEGCYQVSVVNASGREFLSEVYCIEKDRELSIYPTPAASGQTIYLEYEFTDEEKDALSVELYSAKGLLLREFKPSAYPINIEGVFERGQYFVLIRMPDDKTIGAKFIIR